MSPFLSLSPPALTCLLSATLGTGAHREPEPTASGKGTLAKTLHPPSHPQLLEVLRLCKDEGSTWGATLGPVRTERRRKLSRTMTSEGLFREHTAGSRQPSTPHASTFLSLHCHPLPVSTQFSPPSLPRSRVREGEKREAALWAAGGSAAASLGVTETHRLSAASPRPLAPLLLRSLVLAALM